jgi:hypothetical protein
MTYTSPSKTRVPLCAVALVCLTLGACIPPFTTAVEMFDGDYNALVGQREKLEEKHAALRVDYDAEIVKAEAEAAASKEQIDAALERGELLTALKAMNKMNMTLHGHEDSRGTRMNRVVRHAGIGQQEYLRGAAKRGLVLTDEILAQGRFKVVEQSLDEAVSLVQLDDQTKKGFAQRKTLLYTQWLDFLTQSAASVRATHPGSALVYALKGHSIARDTKNTKAEQELGGLIKELGGELERAHGYVFTFGPVSGPHAEETARSVAAMKWGPRISFAPSLDARTHSVISVKFGEPRYSTSQGKDTGSFKYISGTRRVRNPAYQSAESSLSYAKSILSDRESYAGRIASDDSAYDAAQRELGEARSKVSNLQSELASTPQEIDEDVYSEYTYPITLHHLTSSMQCTISSSSLQGLDGVDLDKRLSKKLTDKEHAAHTQGNGSVSADPATPPSRGSGLSALKKLAQSALSGVVLDDMKIYQQSALQGYEGLTDKEDRINQLAIYAFISPGHAEQAYLTQLEDLAQVTDIKTLLNDSK